MPKVVTTIKVDSDILKESKKLAIDKGVTFSELLEEALRKELGKKANEKLK